MTKKQLMFIVCLLYAQHTFPITLVYNLRIRRSFDLPTSLQVNGRTKGILASAVPIFYARNSHIVNASQYIDVCEKRRIGGSLFNIRYAPSKKWWAEITTALATDNSHFTGSDCFDATKTTFDDIVLAGGYRFFIGERTQLVPYGIAGVPTTRKVTLKDKYGPLVGSRFYNIGFGLEASYSFIKEQKQTLSLVLQQRFIHGFNRSWFPILPCDATIQPGNVTDLLGTIQYRRKLTVFESGYNPTFFTNQAVIFPERTVEADSFVRHSAYVSATHLVRNTTFDKPLLIGGGCGISGSHFFDTRIASIWLDISMLF